MNGSKLYLKKHVKKIKGQRRKQLNSRLLFKRFMECFKKWMYEWPFIKRQTSGLSSDNEWQRMTASDNEWQGTVQRVTTSGTTSDNEWQQVATNDSKWQRVYIEWQQVTKSDSEWQWVTASESSGTANENGTVHFKEWLIAIISMTKRDTLLLQGMDGCN